MFLRDCSTNFFHFNEKDLLFEGLENSWEDNKLLVLSDNEESDFNGKTHIICDKFIKPLNNLPLGITHLYLSLDFNEELDFLPISLKFLSIKGKFNNPLKNLPHSLKYLFIEGEFNNELEIHLI